MSGRPTAAMSLLYTESPLPPMITYLPSLLCIVADGTTPVHTPHTSWGFPFLALHLVPLFVFFWLQHTQAGAFSFLSFIISCALVIFCSSSNSTHNLGCLLFTSCLSPFPLSFLFVPYTSWGTGQCLETLGNSLVRSDSQCWLRHFCLQDHSLMRD